MTHRFLVLETSGAEGHVALAEGERIVFHRALNRDRRHASDLAPAIADALGAAGVRVRDLAAILISWGPGSYTGLRVGIISAKALAYAGGVPLVGVDTFAAIALQAIHHGRELDVLGDAQQGLVYVQRFARGPTPEPRPVGELAVRAYPAWQADREAGVWATGPALRRFRPDVDVVDPRDWDPRVESVLLLGSARFARGERDDPWALEPLYCRPSAAEEQWRKKDRQGHG